MAMRSVTVVCQKTAQTVIVSRYKAGKVSRYPEADKMAVMEYLENGGSQKDLINGLVELGVSPNTAYANIRGWRGTNFEHPISYARRVPKATQSTRYENSTLSRLKKLLGF